MAKRGKKRPTQNSGGSVGGIKNLKPYPEGVSGNPGGRPKMLKELKERIQEGGSELVEKLFSIALDPPKVSRINRRTIVDGPNYRERVMAIEKLLAYGYGRPVLAVEVSGPGGGPLETRDIDKLTSTERAKRLVELLVKAGARALALPPAEGGDGGAGGP